MSLKSGSSQETISANIAELVRAGHPQKQAEAIAYKEAGEDSGSKRVEDTNGWIEVKDNPLSKVGIFPYSGRSIGAPEPDRIYNVYRPEEELNNSATLESFKLIPWVDDHTMLGSSQEGLTPAEHKGVNGVIGEEVYFKDGILYGNIKIFAENMKDLIAEGKRELSAGYRCAYELVSGMWNGQQYDAIQRSIRGNHLALVHQGRMGPDVAVLDHLKITFDAKELITMADKEKDDDKKAMDARMSKALDWIEAKMAKDATEEEEKKKAEDGAASEGKASEGEAVDEDEDKDKKGEDKDEEAEKKEEKGMDAKEVKRLVTDAIETAKASTFKEAIRHAAARDSLASKLSHHIGTFAHDGMTLDEVAAYGVKKLDIECPKGHEVTALDAYMCGKKASTAAYGMDTGSNKRGKLSAIINDK